MKVEKNKKIKLMEGCVVLMKRVPTVHRVEQGDPFLLWVLRLLSQSFIKYCMMIHWEMIGELAKSQN